MNHNRFTYFLNAVFYCMWWGEIRFSVFVRTVIDGLLSILMDILFFPRSVKEKFRKHQEETLKELNQFYYDKKRGFCIGQADFNFGCFYSGYSLPISLSLWGLVVKIYGSTPGFKGISFVVVLAIAIIITGLCYIPVRRAVFSNKRYLKYFKQFDEEDKEWHRKWAIITWAFCVGGIVMSLVGMAIAMEIMIGWENIYLPFLPH